jgi:N-acetylneuraminate synthase
MVRHNSEEDEMIRFIADVGSNHNGDINRIETLIRNAKEIGCFAVKFQLFSHDRLWHPSFVEQRNMAKERELSPRFIPEIASLCRKYGIQFHCTPFDIEAVSFLRPFVDAYKIGSYEILNTPLIEACARTGKPISLAGGNCSAEELRTAFINARMLNHRITTYHCDSHYPAYPSQCNLWMLRDMKNKFEAIGWSDHTVSPGVIFYAIAYGAENIEFHLDLNDEKGDEYHHGHCWTVSKISAVIDEVLLSESSMGVNELDIDLRKWRMDPADGLRPLREYRDELKKC